MYHGLRSRITMVAHGYVRLGAEVEWPDCINSNSRAGSVSSRAVKHTVLLVVLPKRGCIEEDIQIPNLLMKKGLAGII